MNSSSLFAHVINNPEMWLHRTCWFHVRYYHSSSIVNFIIIRNVSCLNLNWAMLENGTKDGLSAVCCCMMDQAFLGATGLLRVLGLFQVCTPVCGVVLCVRWTHIGPQDWTTITPLTRGTRVSAAIVFHDLCTIWQVPILSLD